MGEPPSSSGENHVSLQESLVRLWARNGIPTGPGTSRNKRGRFLVVWLQWTIGLNICYLLFLKGRQKYCYEKNKILCLLRFVFSFFPDVYIQPYFKIKLAVVTDCPCFNRDLWNSFIYIHTHIYKNFLVICESDKRVMLGGKCTEGDGRRVRSSMTIFCV